MQTEITELKFQQNCFLYYWNFFPNKRGKLFCIHNTPENNIKGTLLKGAGLVKGIPDLIYLFNNGKYCFIELKHGTKQSNFQRWFETIVNHLNGMYVVIETLDQFKELIVYLESIDIPLPILPAYPKG